MIKPFLAVAALAVLLCAGCATPASTINQVSIGMTKDQVLKVMGEPASITADTNLVCLNYALQERLGDLTTPYEIKLIDGKVVSYGRAGTSNARQPVPMPIIIPAAR